MCRQWYKNTIVGEKCIKIAVEIAGAWTESKTSDHTRIWALFYFSFNDTEVQVFFLCLFI